MKNSSGHHEHEREHQTTMFSSLHEKQKVGKYCDVVLKCCDSDQLFNAHSCVLSAASPVFDKLLQDAMDDRSDNPSSDASLPKLTVKLPSDVASSCVESLLNFIYSGNVDLNIKKERPSEFCDKSDQMDNMRKTRRNSAAVRTKANEDVAACSKRNDSSVEISSLYEFLKASRCLEIQMLTEHLESAATLAKMKTGSPDLTPSERPPRRASAIKFQNLLKTSLLVECKQEPLDMTENGRAARSKRRKQMPSDNQTTHAKSQKNKQLKKKVVQQEKNATVDANSGSSTSQHAKTKAQIHEADTKATDSDSPIKSDDTAVNEIAHCSYPAEVNECEAINKPELSPQQTSPIAEENSVSDEDAEAGKELEEVNICSPKKVTQRDEVVVNKQVENSANERLSEEDSSDIGEDDRGQDEWTPRKSKREKLKVDNGEGRDIKRKTRSTIFSNRSKKGKATSCKQKSRKPGDLDSLQTCEICGKSCANSRNLANHMRSHSRPELSCSYCQQKFKYKTALKRHLLWHTGDGQNCPICKISVYSQRELSQHMSTHNLKKMRTQCTVCEKWFTSAYVMQLHLRTHTGDELFSCRICKKKFPYKSSLKMHMMLHTGEKPYMCSACGKSFTQKIHAKEHELQHTGYKRFRCTHCERYFAHKCGLTRHISDIHYKNRPFVCETCGKSFPRKTKLIEHTRIHTGEKPYVCDICGVKYKANRSLKCHKKNRHNISVPDYEVGIWRKGPSHKVTEPPDAAPEQEKNSTFNFPVNSETVAAATANKEEENIINNIAKEVDVIATDIQEPASSDTSPASAPSREYSPHFQYPSPQCNSMDEAVVKQSLVPVVAITGETTTALPPASTLAKVAHGTVLPTFPTLQDQNMNKTFIVPLNPGAASVFPVLGDQTQSMFATSQVPSGMMLTYMMPAQNSVHTSEIPATHQTVMTDPSSHPLEMSRSASVPPMSTFRRTNQGGIVAETASSAVSLPGMHTFHSVAMTHHHQLLSRFTPMHPAVPVLVPAPVMSGPHAPASVSMETLQTPITLASSEWQTQEDHGGI